MLKIRKIVVFCVLFSFVPALPALGKNIAMPDDKILELSDRTL